MDTILQIKGISKSFPGVKALDDINMDVRRGSIHALVGENGAGKSTFIKILTGIYQPDSGEIIFDGEALSPKSPLEAQKKGLSVVHQELKLVDTLTVKENIYLGRLPVGRMGVSQKQMYRDAKKLLDDLHVNLDPDELVSKLSVAQQQIVEICKALSFDSKMVIMDEPSATLTDVELKLLFDILRSLNEKGMTIIYISHRLEEVFQLSDTVTVFRDGKHIATKPTAELKKSDLISLMVGRELGMEYPPHVTNIGTEVLRVENLNRKNVFKNISFTLHEGEILGLAGLVGSGRTEVARAIFAADHYDSGHIYIHGKESRIRGVEDAISHKIGLVPEDRKKQGLVLGMPLKMNVSMANFKSILKGFSLSFHRENQIAETFTKKLRIMTPSIDQKVKYLSGGNQQKVVIAKWLNADTDILIIDEPTRGIDVGAKLEIYLLINELIKQGKSILIISSDMQELIGICDRILVMHEGRITGELYRSDFNQEKILEYAIL